MFDEVHLLCGAGYRIPFVGNLRERKSSGRMMELPTTV
jgi:hypothetical protein